MRRVEVCLGMRSPPLQGCAEVVTVGIAARIAEHTRRLVNRNKIVVNKQDRFWIECYRRGTSHDATLVPKQQRETTGGHVCGSTMVRTPSHRPTSSIYFACT